MKVFFGINDLRGIRGLEKFLIFSIIFCSPFFEGGDSVSGILFVHTVIALTLIAQLYRIGVTDATYRINSISLFALPFLFFYSLSVSFSLYGYSSFLALVKILAAAAVFLIIYNSEVPVKQIASVFVVNGIAQVILVLISNTGLMHGYGLLLGGGTFLHPGHLAVYLLICVAMTVGFVPGERVERRKIYLLLLLIAFLLTGAYLTWSRIAPVGVVFLLILLLSRLVITKKKLLLIFVLLFLVLSIFLISQFEPDDPYRFHRIKIWKASLDAFIEKPVTGWGPGNFRYSVLNHNFPNMDDPVHYSRVIGGAESGYLELAAESGILTFLAFILFVVIVYLRFYRRREFLWFLLPVSMYLFCALFHSIFTSTALMTITATLAGCAFRLFEKKYFAFKPPCFLMVSLVLIVYIGAVLIPYTSHHYFVKMNRAESASELMLYYNRAVTLTPYQPYYHSLLSKVLSSNGELNIDKLHFVDSLLEKSISLNPLEPDFLVERARLSRKFAGEFGGSEAMYGKIGVFYENAARLNICDASILYEWATFNILTGNHEKAENLLKEALRLEPNFLNARLMLWNIYREKNETEPAQIEYALYTESSEYLKDVVPSSTYEKFIITANSAILEKEAGAAVAE